MANTVKKLILAAATFAGACTSGLQQARMNQVNAEAQEEYSKRCALPWNDKLEKLRQRAENGEASALETRQHGVVLSKGNAVCSRVVELKRLKKLHELTATEERRIQREEGEHIVEMYGFKKAVCEEMATLSAQEEIGAKRGTMSKSTMKAIYNKITAEKETCLAKTETWLQEERVKYELAYGDASLDDYMEHDLVPTVKASTEEPAAKTELKKPAAAPATP